MFAERAWTPAERVEHADEMGERGGAGSRALDPAAVWGQKRAVEVVAMTEAPRSSARNNADDSRFQRH